MSQMEMITDFFPMGITPIKNKKSNKGIKINMSKDEFKRARSDHRKEIDKLKATIKESRRGIRSHRLLIKQARLTYKVTKLGRK